MCNNRQTEWLYVVGLDCSGVKENRCPTSATTTIDSSTTSPQRHHRHRLTGFLLAFHQRQSSTLSAADPTRRRRGSPSIFSSVDELARGSDVAVPQATVSPAGGHLPYHVTSHPVTAAQRSPLGFDLSADSGFGDSALRELTPGFDRTPEVVSMTTDDVNMTPMKVADLQPIKPVVTATSVLRHQSTSASGIGLIAADASMTRISEELRPGGEISAMLSVAMETASSPRQQQQYPQDNAQLIHSSCDVTNPHLMTRKSPKLTDGSEDNKFELIHGGYGVKNPLLTSTTDSRTDSPTNSQPGGKLDYYLSLMLT